MNKNLLVVIYAILTVIILSGINYTGNINVHVSTITETYSSVVSHFSVQTVTKVQTSTVLTTITETSEITISAAQTLIATVQTTTVTYVYTSFVTTSTVFVAFFAHGDGEPNVVFLQYYNPTTSTMNTITVFDTKIMITPYSIIEFIHDNTTSAVVPRITGDLQIYRTLFTIADPMYLAGVYVNWTRYVGSSSPPLQPLDYLLLVERTYSIDDSFSTPLLPHFLITTNTLDYYGLEELYIVLLVNNDRVPTIIFPKSFGAGFAVMDEKGILYGTRVYGDMYAFIVANSLPSEGYYCTFNKFFGITSVFTYSLSVPSVQLPGTTYTLFATTVSGTATTTVNEVFDGSVAYIQFNSEPLMTIIEKEGKYYVVRGNTTVFTTTGFLPFVFTPTNFYRISSTTYAYIVLYSNSWPVIYTGGFTRYRNTFYFEYSAYYYSGSPFESVWGAIVVDE